MLTRLDRVQVVVPDTAVAALRYRLLLEAETAGEDRVRALAARRLTLRVGRSAIELLEPDGAGPAADFLAHSGGGLFAAGFALPEIEPLRRHLAARGIGAEAEGGQLFLSPDALALPGLHAVVSPAEERSRVGVLEHLYEATLLVADAPAVVHRTAEVFGLEAAHFVPIQSREFGYQGTLTLFDPDRLDRLEIITPTDPHKTMGRFFARRGASLYMCYAEAGDIKALRGRLLEHAPDDWTGAREGAALDNLFIHPRALGGMMMGVSRASVGWTWSGHPERVLPAPGV